MTLHFRTRELARKFHAQRKAKGLPGKLVDHGKDCANKLSRYGVSLR